MAEDGRHVSRVPLIIGLPNRTFGSTVIPGAISFAVTMQSLKLSSHLRTRLSASLLSDDRPDADRFADALEGLLAAVFEAHACRGARERADGV